MREKKYAKTWGTQGDVGKLGEWRGHGNRVLPTQIQTPRSHNDGAHPHPFPGKDLQVSVLKNLPFLKIFS